MEAIARCRSIFINCPFDAGYEPLFDALTFAVLYCGYEVRSALEVSDAGELRLAKNLRLIAGSGVDSPAIAAVGRQAPEEVTFVDRLRHARAFLEQLP